MSHDDSLGPAHDIARARRLSTILTVGSVLCGIGAFVAAVVVSQLLGAEADSEDLITGAVIACLVAFAVLLTGCIVLGYAAARRRPPSD